MSDEYVLLIQEPNWNPDEMTAEEWQAGMAGHKVFQDAVAAAGERITASSALQAVTQATRITHGPDGEPVFTNGPFGETSEVVTGFYGFTASSPCCRITARPCGPSRNATKRAAPAGFALSRRIVTV